MFAKKSHNAINIIAAISIIGITVGTIAFITVLSVFNGFDFVVRELFNSFYADLEVVPSTGKTFSLSGQKLDSLKNMEGVLDIAPILEENALLMYGNRQTVATVRGVNTSYKDVTGLDTMIWDGEYKLWEGTTPQAVIGRGIKYMLNIETDFFESLRIIVPRRTEKIYLDPNRALNSKLIRPAGFFASQPELEIKYVIVPLDFARDLFNYSEEFSALEIRVDPKANQPRVQRSIQNFLGVKYLVKNRIQQNDLLYRTMRSEKWAIFFILAFILLVASFNVVGTLSMLIIEKKNDINTLRHLGSDMRTIRKTFLLEGIIIAFLGAIAGLIIGTTLCLLQQEFGIVKLQGSESFVIDAYPVKILFTDILLVFLTVSVIGLIASWYPIRFITRKYLSTEN